MLELEEERSKFHKCFVDKCFVDKCFIELTQICKNQSNQTGKSLAFHELVLLNVVNQSNCVTPVLFTRRKIP